MKLVDLHIRVFFGHRRDPLVPIWHRDGDAVRLRCGGQMLLRPRPRQLEGKLEDSVHSAPSERALLNDDFILRALVDPAANRGVLPLIILPDDVEVDVARLAIAKRRRDARHQPYRAQVCVLSELPPDWNQQTPEGDVIRYSREAYRAEENRIVVPDPL